MDIFDLLALIGGFSLFLFGMSVMGQALERRAGGQLRTLLGKLTSSRTAGLMTGIGVTAVIQSSSATTVMVVGFVNSGLMTLRQAVGVIMGANIGTTVTAWILSLAGISGGNIFLQLLKPSSFTPVLALAGILSVIMSTADSYLLVSVQTCVHDIGKTFFPDMKDKTEILLSRVFSIILPLGALVIALYIKNAYNILMFAWEFWPEHC